MRVPKASEAGKELFRSVLPADPRVEVKPMFGNLGAFVNGNMFAGLFGDGLFVRVASSDADALVEAGGGPFEPMPGRAMTGYTMLPEAWRGDARQAGRWVETALTFGRSLPPKAPKPKKAKLS